MSEEKLVEISLAQVADYEFRVRFDGTALPELTTDEPPPLGKGAGPNPSMLLLAGVANCLAASLLFALRKFRDSPARLEAKARARMTRNEQKRWRVAGIEVELQLADTAAALPHLERALAQFEDFCIVTESVRAGIPVVVRVRDGDGNRVHAAATQA